MWKETGKNKEYIALLISMIVIALVTLFTQLDHGAGGDIWDLTYHLLRIESVKEALANGDFPARINPIFFCGYGYGSSLFYPDLFLLVPGLLCLAGVPLLLACKLTLVMISLAGTCTSYFSFKFITGDRKCALTGTYVLMLSVYYLADVNYRSGVSSYLACIFVPVLLAAIYDYFYGEGTRTYLFGIAFLGMGLSHTIMTFVGGVVTLGVFVVMLFVPGGRKAIFEKKRLERLLLTAFVSVLLAAYYIFPMVEQMASDTFRYNEPWARVGDYMQGFRTFLLPVGIFHNIAMFGVGIPVLLLMASRLFLGKRKEKGPDLFFAIGLVLLAVMTRIVPWRLLENTILNMIQFTYRFYPYALCFLICGMCMIYSRKRREGKSLQLLLGALVLASVVCGIWQNIHTYRLTGRTDLSKAYVYENSHFVGKGEWLPLGVPEAIFQGEGSGVIVSDLGEELPWDSRGYNRGVFTAAEEKGNVYTLPLIYYKGYRATLQPDGGTASDVSAVSLTKSPEGLVQLELSEGAEGRIEVWYEGTAVQKISNGVSLVTLCGVLVCSGVRLHRKRHEVPVVEMEMKEING